MVHWDNRGGIALFLLPDSPGRNRCQEIADRISSMPGKAFCNGVRCIAEEARFRGVIVQVEELVLKP